MKDYEIKAIVIKVFAVIIIVLMAAGSYYLLFMTRYFNIKKIEYSGNTYYDTEYLNGKSEYLKNEKIFLTDLRELRKILENEVYILKVNIKRKLPSQIYVKITEREEFITAENEGRWLILDREGIPLDCCSIKKQGLYEIYIGDRIEFELGKELVFSGLPISQAKILDFVKYVDGNETNIFKRLVILPENMFLEVETGTLIKLNLKGDMFYQYEFALRIIDDRKRKNLDLDGMIDFTKGENPVYVDAEALEDNIYEK